MYLAHQGLIEELFQEGLIKAVFATETLAAGVNMPARCTVITVISKRGNNGIAPLVPSAVLQMAGRAGRRGKDDLGHVVLCRSPFEDAAAAHNLLLQPVRADERRTQPTRDSLCARVCHARRADPALMAAPR